MAASPSAATARESSSLPSSRAACLARLAAAAIRIGVLVLRLEGRGQRLERVDLAAARRAGLERLERAQRQGQVLRQLGVRRSGLVELGGEQVGQLAQELRVAARAWRRSGSGWPARTPTASWPDGMPELPDIFHRVALAAGQLAEEQPDDDHHHDHHRRDHEELHDEPGGRRLDRRQSGSGGGLSGFPPGSGNVEYGGSCTVAVLARCGAGSQIL